MPEHTPSPAPDPLSPEGLKLALKAFNKRLRLTRLDDESKLGHGAMTGGGKSGIVAISPPNQFPKAVWDELVKQGKLKYVGKVRAGFVPHMRCAMMSLLQELVTDECPVHEPAGEAAKLYIRLPEMRCRNPNG